MAAVGIKQRAFELVSYWLKDAVPFKCSNLLVKQLLNNILLVELAMG